jgi:hypothetical protein
LLTHVWGFASFANIDVRMMRSTLLAWAPASASEGCVGSGYCKHFLMSFLICLCAPMEDVRVWNSNSLVWAPANANTS